MPNLVPVSSSPALPPPGAPRPKRERLPNSVEWHRLDAGYAILDDSVPQIAAMVATALLACIPPGPMNGKIWLGVWALAIGAMATGSHFIAARFMARDTAANTSSGAARWEQTYDVISAAQAGLLGIGAIAALLVGNVGVVMVVLPLAAYAMQLASRSVYTKATWLQLGLLLGPLVVWSFASHMALLGELACLQLGICIYTAGRSSERTQEAAFNAILAQCPPPPNAATSADLSGMPGVTGPAMPAGAIEANKILGRCPITGLPNRHSFTHYLDHEAATAERAQTHLSVLLIQIDGMNAVNEPGRQAQMLQKLLASIARRLHTELRRPTDSIASLNNGLFGVILPFTDALGADNVARNLHASMVYEDAAVNEAGALPISIGLSTFCGKGAANPTQLREQAAEALAFAQRQEGVRVHRYDPIATTLRPKPYTGPRAKEENIFRPAVNPAERERAPSNY